MKVCSHCGKPNPNRVDYCYNCGNMIKYTVPSSAVNKKTFWSKLPSWAWILIGLGGIALLLVIIIGGFIGLSTIEGFASIIFLVIGIFSFRVFSGQPPSNIPILRAIMIGFFALMGATVDQTGNYIYNKPIEMCMCPAGSQIQRITVTTNPLPGRTDMTQDFTCVEKGKVIETLNVFPILGIRFLEYIVLAYLLIGARWLFWRWKMKRMQNVN